MCCAVLTPSLEKATQNVAPFSFACILHLYDVTIGFERAPLPIAPQRGNSLGLRTSKGRWKKLKRHNVCLHLDAERSLLSFWLLKHGERHEYLALFIPCDTVCPLASGHTELSRARLQTKSLTPASYAEKCQGRKRWCFRSALGGWTAASTSDKATLDILDIFVLWIRVSSGVAHSVVRALSPASFSTESIIQTLWLCAARTSKAHVCPRRHAYNE